MCAYEQVVAGVKSKIYISFTASLAMKKSVEEIANKLDSPECRKNILLVTHQILQSSKYALKRKIEIIAIGILRKNLSFVCRFEQIDSLDKELTERMTYAREQLDALKIRLDSDKLNTRYKVVSPDSPKKRKNRDTHRRLDFNRTSIKTNFCARKLFGSYSSKILS